MGLPENDRSRPGINRAASNVNNDDTPRVPRSADVLADLDALAEHLRAYLVLQVTVDDNGHRRTQVYRSAAAVERAVRRAQERGRQAHVTLCQLLPVGVVSSLNRAPDPDKVRATVAAFPYAGEHRQSGGAT